MLTTTKASQAGAFAFTFGKGQLGAGQPMVTVNDDGAIARFSANGVPYAELVLDGDAVVVALAVVEDDRPRARMSEWREDPHRRGWMHIRVGRAARDWVDAGVNALAQHAIQAAEARRN
jgi:hypothetical protein